MKLRTCLSVLVVCLAVSAAPAAAATVVNGNFETGTLAGWTVNNQGGAWSADTGPTSPISNQVIAAPPQGLWAAVADQNGPSSMVLYQDVVLAPGQQHTLSFQTYYYNRHSQFVTPNSLETSVQNQQYRVDVMKPTAPIRSVAASDVLATPFRTVTGDPLTRGPFTVTADLSAFAGQTVRLRFVVVDTLFFFQAGVDDVKVNSTTADSDGDGVLDTADNCPGVSNAGQANNDGDSQGDACDADDDNDTVADGGDNCQFVSNADQANNDGDSQGDACDTDDDNDNVADGGDNCQFTSNPDQAELNSV
jgi:hypothetical protein